MSRTRSIISSFAVTFGLVLSSVAFAPAPATATEAGFDCSNVITKSGKKVYKANNLVFTRWYYNSGSDACWTVHDEFGRKVDWIVRVTKKNTDTGKKKASVQQLNNKYTVGGAPSLTNRIVDVEVWAYPSGSTAENYIAVRLNAA